MHKQLLITFFLSHSFHDFHAKQVFPKIFILYSYVIFLLTYVYVNIQCILPTQGNVDTSLFDYHACYVTWDRKDLLIICIFVFIRHVSIHRYGETFIETSCSYLQDEIEYKWKYVIRLIGSLFFLYDKISLQYSEATFHRIKRDNVSIRKQ